MIEYYGAVNRMWLFGYKRSPRYDLKVPIVQEGCIYV